MISGPLRETVITSALQALDAAHPRSLSAQDLFIPLRHSGLADLELKDLQSLLVDLKGQSLVTEQASPVAAEILRYQRTDMARVWLRQNGF
jgi:hypothetical protein